VITSLSQSLGEHEMENNAGREIEFDRARLLYPWQTLIVARRDPCWKDVVPAFPSDPMAGFTEGSQKHLSTKVCQEMVLEQE
jgi:hypothetical protein